MNDDQITRDQLLDEIEKEKGDLVALREEIHETLKQYKEASLDIRKKTPVAIAEYSRVVSQLYKTLIDTYQTYLNFIKEQHNLIKQQKEEEAFNLDEIYKALLTDLSKVDKNES